MRLVKSAVVGFASRLLLAFGVAFILLATLYALFPDLKMSTGAFLISLFVLASVLALVYKYRRTRDRRLGRD